MSDDQARPEVGNRAGVREVAAAAGVSTQTVSRVINGQLNVRPDTRDRVLAAMAALDYRVNNAARALGTRTTRTIGVIASDATLYGPAVGIAALETAAREVGRWIATAYADAADEASVAGAADRLLSQGVDGLVVLAPHAPTFASLTAAYPSVPLAGLHMQDAAAGQRVGAALAVRHLVELGHRRIARLAGPDEWIEATARDDGAVAQLFDAGLEPGPRWAADWSAATAAALAPEIAAAVRVDGGPTAIAVANDQMALGLIAGLHAAGLRVPGDVSVTGFDDNPDAAYYTPALTTVRLDLIGEARRGIGAVIAGQEVALPLPLPLPSPPTLIVRDSTAPPRG